MGREGARHVVGEGVDAVTMAVTDDELGVVLTTEEEDGIEDGCIVITGGREKVLEVAMKLMALAAFVKTDAEAVAARMAEATRLAAEDEARRIDRATFLSALRELGEGVVKQNAAYHKFWYYGPSKWIVLPLPVEGEADTGKAGLSTDDPEHMVPYHKVLADVVHYAPEEARQRVATLLAQKKAG